MLLRSGGTVSKLPDVLDDMLKILSTLCQAHAKPAKALLTSNYILDLESKPVKTEALLVAIVHKSIASGNLVEVSMMGHK